MFDALTLGLWEKMLGNSIDGLFNPRGDYNPNADPPYSKHDVVFDNGSSFRYINDTPSNEPTSSTSHWQQIASAGATVTSAEIVGDDIVITKDDETTVTLVGAKTALTGPKGDTGDPTSTTPTDLTLTDAGGHFSIKNVEAALQQVGSATAGFIEDVSDAVTIPYVGTGAIKASAASGTKFYAGTRNLADIFNFVDGVYTVGSTPGTDQVTVAVIGNKVTVNGVIASPKYCVLSDETGSGNSNGSPAYVLPYSTNLHIRLYNGIFTACPASANLIIRNTAGGNVLEFNLSQETYKNFSYVSTYGKLFLYMTAGAYNCEFHVGLGVGTWSAAADVNVDPDTDITTTDNPFIELAENQVQIVATAAATANRAYPWTRLSMLKRLDDDAWARHGIAVHFYTGANVLIGVGSHDQLDVFIPTAVNGRWLRYNIIHQINVGANEDTWRVNTMQIVTLGSDFSILTSKSLMPGGEWECALMIVGRSDFIGGHAHGDEMTDTVSAYLDGQPIALTGTEYWAYGNKFRLITTSKLYDPADSTTHVANHGKLYDLDRCGLVIDQRVEWLASLSLTSSYLAMWPISRKFPKTSGEQITDTGYNNKTYLAYDLSADNNASPISAIMTDVSRQTLTGSNLGIQFDLEIEKSSPAYSGAGAWISDTPDYNKMYFDFCGASQAVDNATVWRNRARYSVTYKGV